MRNFLPRRKVLNIQYSPRYEPSGAEGSPVRKKEDWRDRRSLVHGEISFFLFSIPSHDSLKMVGTVYRIKDLVDRRTKKKAKRKDDVEENDEGEENRRMKNIFYSQCAWEPTRVSFTPTDLYVSLLYTYPADLPLFRVLPRDTSSGPPRGLDVFDESIRGYFRYANSLPAWERSRPLHAIAMGWLSLLTRLQR